MNKETTTPADPAAAKPNRSALEAAQSRQVRRVRSQKAVSPSRAVPIAMSYARVSTKEQARKGFSSEGYSIPVQRDA